MREKPEQLKSVRSRQTLNNVGPGMVRR